MLTLCLRKPSEFKFSKLIVLSILSMCLIRNSHVQSKWLFFFLVDCLLETTCLTFSPKFMINLRFQVQISAKGQTLMLPGPMTSLVPILSCHAYMLYNPRCRETTFHICDFKETQEKERTLFICVIPTKCTVVRWVSKFATYKLCKRNSSIQQSW